MQRCPIPPHRPPRPPNAPVTTDALHLERHALDADLCHALHVRVQRRTPARTLQRQRAVRPHSRQPAVPSQLLAAGAGWDAHTVRALVAVAQVVLQAEIGLGGILAQGHPLARRQRRHVVDGDDVRAARRVARDVGERRPRGGPRAEEADEAGCILQGIGQGLKSEDSRLSDAC
eukprot:366067-Chlamydomonas_euryale.AAC.5